jgi:myo-inositol-1(or 4)-monophosphatase
LPDADLGSSPLDAAAADLALLEQAAREVAPIALKWFRGDPTVWTKSGGSPVSEADLAVDRRLAEILRSARPDYGWLSEETADGPERLASRRQFVVDPIDGTRAYLAGSSTWAVSLAVVEAGRPVVAMLAAPALGRVWTAIAGEGAWNDGRRLAVADRSGLAGARLSAPRRFVEAPAVVACGFAERRLVPSLALRIAGVADGSLDLALGTRNAHDWDLAAADLLVQEAGARFATASGEALCYNRADPCHPPLVAAVPGLFPAALDLLARIERSPGRPAPG